MTIIDIEQQAELERSIQSQFVGAVLAVATAVGFLLVMLAVLGAMVGVGYCDEVRLGLRPQLEAKRIRESLSRSRLHLGAGQMPTDATPVVNPDAAVSAVPRILRRSGFAMAAHPHRGLGLHGLLFKPELLFADRGNHALSHVGDLHEMPVLEVLVGVRSDVDALGAGFTRGHKLPVVVWHAQSSADQDRHFSLLHSASIQQLSQASPERSRHSDTYQQPKSCSVSAENKSLDRKCA